MKTIKKHLSILILLAFLIPLGVFAQDENKTMVEVRKDGPKYGTDSVSCVQNLSLYREYYKNWKKTKNEEYIKDAIGPWRWCFLNCPISSQNLYIDGANIIKYMISKAADKTAKEAMIDTLMMVYDRRILAFNREGYVLERKTQDMIKYRPKATADIYNTSKKSYDLRVNKAGAPLLYYYLASTIDYVNEGNADTSLIVETYDQVSTSADFNCKNNKKPKKYCDVVENLDNLFIPYATCDVLIAVFTPKFEAEPENVSLLQKITKVLEKQDCIESELFFEATINLDRLEPDSTSKFLIGRMQMKKGEYETAVKYLTEAVGLYKDKNTKANVYLLIADSHSKLNQYSAARSAALKSIENNPNKGIPYILIGNLYAASASSCKYKQLTTAYWVAVDKFYKAKQVDPDESVQEMAQKLINQYSAYFPSKKDIFLHSLSIGNSFSVGCWIGETTKVRSSD